MSAPEAPNATDTYISEVARALDTAAAAEETGEADISASLTVLREAGWLEDDGRSAPERTAGRLRRVGAANLSVGRLFKGHINALLLVRLYGTSKTVAEIDDLITDGAILGVWGADGPKPVGVSPNGATLEGQKIYASGLGTVTHAVVTVFSGPHVMLGLVDVRRSDRADPSSWDMQGMRATASGTYDFGGLTTEGVLWLGARGDYIKEPHFVGGVWRIGALQVGGILGLLDAAASVLRSAGRMDAPAQMARLSEVAVRALGASALVDRAATANATLSPGQAAAVSAAARLLSEESRPRCYSRCRAVLGSRTFQKRLGHRTQIQRPCGISQTGCTRRFSNSRRRSLFCKRGGPLDAILNNSVFDWVDGAALTRGAPIAVFAPHPDDESLGCGGLLAHAFANSGAQIICMTDGSASHPASQAWPPARLAAARRQELLTATRHLGGRDGDVTWLGHPDGWLGAQDQNAISRQIAGICRRRGVRSVFAPSQQDHHEDHKATARIAHGVVALAPELEIYTYAVWSRWDDPDFYASIKQFYAVAFDTEPWRRVKHAAIHAHLTQLGQVVEDDPAGFTMSAGFVDTFIDSPEIYWKAS